MQAEPDIAGVKSLQDILSDEIIDSILQPNSTAFIELDQAGDRLVGASYIPSMNWYVVANVTKVTN